MKTFEISERRACGLMDVWRSSCRYQQKPDRNEALREQLEELASERPRFGYRRLGVLLARQGERVNHKRLFRVYRQAGLSVKRTRHKKLLRIGIAQPVLSQPNQEWSLDFVHDALYSTHGTRSPSGGTITMAPVPTAAWHTARRTSLQLSGSALRPRPFQYRSRNRPSRLPLRRAWARP